MSSIFQSSSINEANPNLKVNLNIQMDKGKKNDNFFEDFQQN